MKRVVLILICLLLAAAGFGCAPGNEGAASFDKGGSNLEENAFFNGYLAARMGDFVYFTEEVPAKGGHKIYVYDSVSGEVFPLCAKPECTHDSGSCGAAYSCGLGEDFFMPYGERLFFLGDIERKDGNRYMRVYSEEKDGTDRRIEVRMAWNEGNNALAYVGIYNGAVYKLGSTNVVENGVGYEDVILYCQSLEEGSEPKELFRSRQQDSVFFAAMRAGKLWFALYEGDGKCHMNLYSYDTETEELKTEFEGKAPDYAFRMSVLDDKLVFYEARTVFTYSFEDGTFSGLPDDLPEEMYEYGGSVIFAWTSWFDYVCMSEDGSVLHQGTLDSSLFKEEKPYKTYLGSINGQFLYLVDGSNEEGVTHNYFLVYDSETDTFSIPWDSEGMYP